MQEKDMLLDILGGVKASLGNYARVIAECANPTLRQTFQKMRDNDEKFQYDLFKIAEQKGYYTPASPASAQDSTTVKSKLTEEQAKKQGGGPVPSYA